MDLWRLRNVTAPADIVLAPLEIPWIFFTTVATFKELDLDVCKHNSILGQRC